MAKRHGLAATAPIADVTASGLVRPEIGVKPQTSTSSTRASATAASLVAVLAAMAGVRGVLLPARLSRAGAVWAHNVTAARAGSISPHAPTQSGSTLLRRAGGRMAQIGLDDGRGAAHVVRQPLDDLDAVVQHHHPVRQV